MYGLGISPELEAAIKQEARGYVERVIGRAYELIPEAVREQIEKTYIQKRMQEIETAAVGVGAKIAPAALIGGGLLLLLLLRR